MALEPGQCSETENLRNKDMNPLHGIWIRKLVQRSFAHGAVFLSAVVIGAGVSWAQEQRRNEPARTASLVYQVHPKTTGVSLDGDQWCTAELTNLGDEPVTVYWGDYAYPGMYRFEIRDEAAGRLLPATRLYSPWPPRDPRSAEPKHFVTIQPGETASYEMLLTSSPGGNCQQVFFRRPGTYVVHPSLHVSTGHTLDRETGELSKMPQAWTGELDAPPFTITVLDDDDAIDQGVKISGTVVAPGGTRSTSRIR
jgi:hypothetical protein